MAKFTTEELQIIANIQEERNSTRKAAVQFFKRHRDEYMTKNTKAAVAPATEAPAAPTMSPDERGKARSEGLRLYTLAGRPKKSDFIRVFGKKGVAWTWEARAKALGIASAEECAAKFQSLLKKAVR